MSSLISKMYGLVRRLFCGKRANTSIDRNEIENTVPLNGSADGDEATSFLWGSGSDGGHVDIVRIKLTDTEDETNVYEARISSFVLIGRDVNSCDIVIPNDMSVSRKHCKIIRDGIEFYVQDMESTIGTFLNGCSLDKEVKIQSGDELTIGNTTFEFSIV